MQLPTLIALVPKLSSPVLRACIAEGKEGGREGWIGGRKAGGRRKEWILRVTIKDGRCPERHIDPC